MKKEIIKNNLSPLGKKVVDLIGKDMPKWVLTYKLKSTDEIYSDVICTADSPASFLEYIAEQWFDDDDAELISITRL